jgi:hypothetical protein
MQDVQESPRALRWKVIALCTGVIAFGHFLAELRAFGLGPVQFSQQLYHFGQSSMAVAFAALTCWLVWYARSSLTKFSMAVLIGVAKWLEVCATFRGFHQFVDQWQWVAIDVTVAVMVSIALKPLLRRLPVRRGLEAVAPLSIADLFLAITAGSVMAAAALSLARLSMQGAPEIPMYGWSQILGSGGIAVLITLVGAASLCLALAASLRTALVIYGLVGLLLIELLPMRFLYPGRAGVTNIPWLNDLLFAYQNPLTGVWLLFAVGMLVIRWNVPRVQAPPPDYF